MPIKTIIMGAAGRDFHNFNTFFRGNKDYEVVAFTATQIPDIEGRLYPAELAGGLKAFAEVSAERNTGRCGQRATQDDIMSICQGVVDRFIGLATHDDRIAHGQLFEEMPILRKIPRQTVTQTDHPIFRHSGDDCNLWAPGWLSHVWSVAFR